MYVRLFEHPNVVLTRPSSTPAMSSGAQRQVPEFTAGRLSHRNPHGSHRSTRGSSQILCRVIGSRSYERGMLGDHTYVVFSFFFRQYGSAAFRYSDERARSTRRFTNSHNISTRSIPTLKAGWSWPTFTRHPTSMLPSP